MDCWCVLPAHYVRLIKSGGQTSDTKSKAEDVAQWKYKIIDQLLVIPLICSALPCCCATYALWLRGKVHGFMAGGRPSAKCFENLNHSLMPFPLKLLRSADLNKLYICHVHVHSCRVYVLHVKKSCLSASRRAYTCCMLSAGCVIICRYSMTPAAF